MLSRALPLALATVLLGAAPAVAAPTWLPPKVVESPSPGETLGQTIASDAAGNTAAAWYKLVGMGPLRYRVQYSLRSPGGDFTPAADLTGDLANAPKIDIGMDNAGTATVIWNVDAGTPVEVRRVDAAGNKSAIQTLTASGSRPHVAVGANGAAVATWSDGTQLQAAVRTSPDGDFVGAGAIGTGAGTIDETGDVAVDAGGNAIAAWVRAGTVETNRRPAGGSFLGVQPIPGSGTDARNLVLAIAPTGQATAMWTGGPVLTSEVRYAERTISPDFAGGGWNPAGRASRAGVQASVPAVALDAQNSAIATWAANDGNAFVESAIRPSGGAFSNFQPLSGTAGAFNSEIGVAPDGSAVAIWRGSSGGKPAVQAARRAPGGQFGAVTDITLGNLTTDPTVDVFTPSIAVDGEGNAAAIWSRQRQGTADPSINEWSVEAAGFDAAPPTLAAVSIPAAASQGATVGMAAAATDRWTPVALSWSFGDGTGALGGAVSHAFGAGAFGVTVTATDGVGNASAASGQILVAAPAPQRRIDATVQNGWGRLGKRFFLLRLKVIGPPKGSAAQIRCSGRRCPFQSRRFTKFRKGNIVMYKNIKPSKAVKKRNRRFRAGQRIQVRVTAQGYIGKVVTFKLKRGRNPVGKVQCLPPGASKPVKCT